MQTFDNIIELLIKKASIATDQRTFGVAGAIVDNSSGMVIHALHNNVIKVLSNNTLFTNDPTAHGERQLVYWYYENRKTLNLPPPSDLTVITSLDPCLMCTGCLLEAGFNVGVVAMDPFAGINYDCTHQFNSLPSNLQSLAKTRFGYYAIGNRDGASLTFSRSYVGPNTVKFYDNVLAAQNLTACSSIFSNSLNDVRDVCNNLGISPANMLDPFELPESSPVKLASRKFYSNALTVKTRNPRTPCIQIRNELERVLAASHRASNAVALIDPFGNLVSCMADNFEISPVHTAFMNVTRAYAQIRWQLIEQYGLSTDEVLKYLSHPKDCTYIFLYAPDPNAATTIMTIGAFGSTMEGEIPNNEPPNLQYYYPPQEGTENELLSMLLKLPPFYVDYAKISITRVPQ